MKSFLDNSIVINESQSTIIRMNFFEYIYLLCKDNIPFVVCNVTEEEFAEMIKQVKTNKLHELEPRLVTKESYNQFRYMMSFTGSFGEEPNSIVIRDYDGDDEDHYVFTCDGLEYKNDERKIETGRRNIKFRKIYTTKSYREVINFFISQTRDLSKVRRSDIKASIKNIDELRLRLMQEHSRLLSYVYDLEEPLKSRSEFESVLKKQ